MALKIRLRQQGRNNYQTYRLVLADVRSPRDGKYIEMLGWYNPMLADKNADLKEERINYWLSKGATLSERAFSLLERTIPSVARQYTSQQHAKRTALAAKRRKAKKSA